MAPNSEKAAQLTKDRPTDFVAHAQVIEPQTRYILEHLGDHTELFLKSWTAYMAETGYIAFTTARRSDCTLSFQQFIDAMLLVLNESNEIPSFADLLKKPQWAESLLLAGQRHRMRGVTFAMYMGCFKTFLHAVADAVDQFDSPLIYKKQALILIWCLGDAFETLLAEDNVRFNQQEVVKILDDTNRQLSLEKCKYENILNLISELVFIADSHGKIIETNQSARRYLEVTQLNDRYLWEFFPLSAQEVKELTSHCLSKYRHSLVDPKNNSYFDITLMALNDVSLASNAYLFVFTDISFHIKQKSILEKLVAKRTSALVHEKVQLEEMNITLKTVLNSIEKQKKESLTSKVTMLKEQIYPLLQRLKIEKSSEAREVHLSSLEKRLTSLLTEASDENESILPSELTSMEIRICQMLRNGLSSKNIAQALNLSVETVHTHRKHIRSKLGLHGEKTSLFKYLNSTEQFK